MWPNALTVDISTLTKNLVIIVDAATTTLLTMHHHAFTKEVKQTFN